MENPAADVLSASCCPCGSTTGVAVEISHIETSVAAAALAETLHAPKRAAETSAAQAETPAASVGAAVGAKVKAVEAAGERRVI